MNVATGLELSASQTEANDQDRVRFDREKWRDEVRLRERELDIKERAQKSQEQDTELRHRELTRSKWSSPLIIAILGTAAAATGNLLVNWFNSYEQQILERNKAEAARILEVVKTADPDKAAANLGVLMDTYLITDPSTREHFQAYLDKRKPGQGLALPTAAPTVTQNAFQPVPVSLAKWPYHMDLASVVGAASADIEKSGKLVFQVAGNTGGVKNPAPQQLVADAMQVQLAAGPASDRPAFLYLLGNMIFYDGEPSNYLDQFYLPYQHYGAPIFAIPGNHDGVSVGVDGPHSLQGFLENFCAAQPVLRYASAGVVRAAMNQPNPYWSLQTPFATILGLYTNVPGGGVLDDKQAGWLAQEMKTAPSDRALIIALHHSPLSFNAPSKGSSTMMTALQAAINASGRIPNAILSATNFNYQRIEMATAGSMIPFFVIGSGGYPNLHKLSDAMAAGVKDAETEAVLAARDDKHHGFATFEIGREDLKGTFHIVTTGRDNIPPEGQVVDTFSYTAKPIYLPPGEKLKWTIHVSAEEN